MIQNKNNKIVNGAWKADRLRTTGPENNKVVSSSLVYFFCLRYTRFRGKEASNPDRTTGTETKKKKKKGEAP